MSSTPFSRTLRSLDADGFGPSLVAIILAMLLLLGWGMWFFFANIPLTEATQNVEITKNETIIAIYSPKAMTHLQQGQDAYVRLEGLWPETLPAIVMDVNYETGRVELFAEQDLSYVDGIREQVDHVEIEVEEVSPATLVMRASGLFEREEITQ